MPTFPEYVDAHYTFERAAHNYDCRPDYPAEFYSFLDERLSNCRDDLGLDLGCGSGRVALHLAKQGWRVVAADLAQSMLHVVSEKLVYNPVTAYPLRLDAACLPFRRSCLGFILTGQAYHWMRREAVAAEVLRVLQADGLWIVFWTQPAERDSLCTRLTQEYLLETIPGYSAQAAQDLEGKHAIPFGLSLQVEKLTIHYCSTCPLSRFVASVTSWSFVINALHDPFKVQQFTDGLYRWLVNGGVGQVVEEPMCLTVLCARRIANSSEIIADL